MVEVFKTNVVLTADAEFLIKHIQDVFIGYIVNFDLEDCDNILRVENEKGEVEPSPLINLLKEHGFLAKVLPDYIQTESIIVSINELTA